MEMPAVAYNRPEIRYAWRGPSLLIVDPDGVAGSGAFSGFFFREARYLKDLRLLVDGEMPFVCSNAEASPNRLEFTYIYPPVQTGGGGGSGSGGSGERHGILFRDLVLRATYRVRPASLEVRLTVQNAWQEPVAFDLAWALAADYEALLSTMGPSRQQEAPVEAHPEEDGVRFRYTHPELPLETHVAAEGGGRWTYGDGKLSTHVALERQETAEIVLRIHAVDSEDPISTEEEDRREERLAAWYGTATRLSAPGEGLLADITNRCTRDLGSLALLEGGEEEWLAPAAGMPLYPSLFARDATTAAWQACVFDRGEQLASLLPVLDRMQGAKFDDRHDEEPGRIIRQHKRDPLARLDKDPFGHYYGDFASPLMFVISLGQYYAWTGDEATLRRHWNAARGVLDWARQYGDRDGDGYLEYLTRSEKGPKNQGWKDSENAVVYEDGSQVEAPVAPSEIQGYYYAALQFMSVLSGVLGEAKSGIDYGEQAARLKEQFNRDFWVEEEGCIGFGLDPDKRLIRSITSNAGHCLTSGIVEEDKIPRLVERLFRPDLFSGWGIRTLSTENPAFNPLGYHVGSVWSVENGTILFGLRRYGFDEEAERLARALFDLARLWPNYRIPECVGGFARDEMAHPGAYPRANAPQAWNQSTFPIIVQALLGLRPVASLGLLAVDPVLPEWAPELTVEGLRVGEAIATIRFRRKADGTSSYEVLEQEGSLKVVRQPPLDDLHVGLWDRLGAVVKGGLPLVG